MQFWTDVSDRKQLVNGCMKSSGCFHKVYEIDLPTNKYIQDGFNLTMHGPIKSDYTPTTYTNY